MANQNRDNWRLHIGARLVLAVLLLASLSGGIYLLTHPRKCVEVQGVIVCGRPK